MADESPRATTAREGAALTDPHAADAALSRARFLTGATAGVGAVIGAAILIPTVGFAFGPAFAGEKWYWTNIGPAADFPFDAKAKSQAVTSVKFSRDPTEGTLGARIAFVRRDTENVADGMNSASFTIMSNTCMHMGCPIQGSAGGYACPCHGGQYDVEGRRTAGPPVRPLNRFEHKIEKGSLYIGRVFASEEKGGKVQMTSTWKDPGQPVDGLLSFLYPAPPR